MKIREIVGMTCREAMGVQYDGGVKGCPKHYPGLVEYDYCENGKEMDCEKCWSQEYREDREREKKFDASVVFVVLAVLEALWSIIAVVCGDSEWLRFCCVMGLLYVIAAGVWRDKA